MAFLIFRNVLEFGTSMWFLSFDRPIVSILMYLIGNGYMLYAALARYIYRICFVVWSPLEAQHGSYFSGAWPAFS